MTGQGKAALVADDHELFGAALAAVLKRDLGFAEVIGTGSFDEALAALTQRADIALATFDLAMPGMDDSGRIAAGRHRGHGEGPHGRAVPQARGAQPRRCGCRRIAAIRVKHERFDSN